MILCAGAWAAALAVGEGRVAFVGGGVVGEADLAGELLWSLPFEGVEAEALAVAGGELRVFAQGELWIFAGGRLVAVREATALSAAGDRSWTGTAVESLGADGIRRARVRSGEAIGPGLFAGAATLPADQDCVVFAVDQAACGRPLRRLRLDGSVLGPIPGEQILAAGPGGLVSGPPPTLVAADGAPRAVFDPAEAWAVGTDAAYALRDGELRAFTLEGHSRWTLVLAASPPSLAGELVEGARTSFVVEDGVLAGGWVGRADRAGRSRSYATKKGGKLVSTATVGKGRRKRAAWTLELAPGEQVVENGAAIVLASPTGWRLFDGKSGRRVAAGSGLVGPTREGWLRVSGPEQQQLVRVATGEVLEFPAEAQVAGVLRDGAVVVLGRDLVVSVGASPRWSVPAPAQAEVAGELVICRDPGVIYARAAADGAVRWAMPWGEGL